MSTVNRAHESKGRFGKDRGCTLLLEISASAELTRLELTRDLFNVNRENLSFWSALINANFNSYNKKFDFDVS